MSENPEQAFGLLACPVPDGASTAFQRFLGDYKFELGGAGGKTVIWRPIGHPAKIDDVYREMRTPELRERDEADAIRYEEECQKHGDADHYDQLQYHRVVALFGLQEFSRPLILFMTAPDVGRRAVLSIDVRVFDTPEQERKFGELLCRRLTEERILKCSKNGVFTKASMAKLQKYLDHVRNDIRVIAEPSVDSTSLPARFLLILKELKNREGQKSFLARIVGNGRFEGVDKKLGSRQLFFVYLLFNSEEEHLIDGEYRTVVTEAEVVQELLEWNNAGYLRLSGPDKDKPTHRVLKMWHGFTQQIETEPKLSGLFKRERSNDMNLTNLYTLGLRPIQTQVNVINVSTLFKHVTAR